VNIKVTFVPLLYGIRVETSRKSSADVFICAHCFVLNVLNLEQMGVGEGVVPNRARTGFQSEKEGKTRANINNIKGQYIWWFHTSRTCMALGRL